jgi:hypothetical protein
MRRWILVLLFCLAGLPAAAQDVSEADAEAIRSVIESQMAAFRADDAPRAFGYASPQIQAMFRTPEIFMEMVREGYQPVYRPQEVEFLDLLTTPQGLTQRVLVVGPDGVPVVADYFMERQPDGNWRIDGCMFEREADRTA